MSRASYSILREEEYAGLSRMSFRGSVLDIGGSKRSGYHELLQKPESITTANSNPAYDCDLVFDAQEVWPIRDETYDHVLSLNLFEHLYHFQNAFSESARVLKQDGTLVVSVPFLFQIHTSPDDYFRYTRSALERILEESGFREVHIEALGFGLCSLFFQIAGGAVPSAPLRRIFKIVCVGLDKMLLRFSKKYRVLNERIPLGYFVIAKK